MVETHPIFRDLFGCPGCGGVFTLKDIFEPKVVAENVMSGDTLNRGKCPFCHIEADWVT